MLLSQSLHGVQQDSIPTSLLTLCYCLIDFQWLATGQHPYIFAEAQRRQLQPSRQDVCRHPAIHG